MTNKAFLYPPPKKQTNKQVIKYLMAASQRLEGRGCPPATACHATSRANFRVALLLSVPPY